MLERVKAQSEDFLDVVVQFHPEHNMLGIGLEPHGGQHHFVDGIYGGNENQIKIGKLFLEKTQGKTAPDFPNISDEEHARYLSELGRTILDSVTGSTPAEGLWTWLSRPASNRLVRLVRKGRDVSFGRDE